MQVLEGHSGKCFFWPPGDCYLLIGPVPIDVVVAVAVSIQIEFRRYHGRAEHHLVTDTSATEHDCFGVDR